MTEPHPQAREDEQVDLGDYCRRVEECLARVNEGHLIRIVGPAFELVRGWALSGVPLGIVFKGIEQKAARHKAGRSKRPLRLEFCESDVRAVYDDWRRAVGLVTRSVVDVSSTPAIEERRRPSLSRQLERAIDMLVRAAGRLDATDRFRMECNRVLDQLVVIRDESRRARGDARKGLNARLVELDRAIVAIARESAGEVLRAVEAEATADLGGYRSRLSPEAWARTLDASVDRLLRERLALPSLDVVVESEGTES